MSRELDFDLVRSCIENALAQQNYEVLENFRHGAENLIVQLNKTIAQTIDPIQNDLKLLHQATQLYFLTISLVN